ncbi:dephospho-CoA kinase [Streptococcus iniae]|uniref:Dephospho-CoA kinase n=1 Tax=Streptococcus iniae TaxID=1346 RepID=A0A3L8GGP7_STRIN|nr:dephospho-CoA kinase [Streptococcus iniae]EKB51674.1 dephospho-CoA kinase [Streptococcus iniae 9117]AJG26318.1 dephospho-CoA kinase [Streptococcus iniae]APD32198.1 dephospho-CoA kinase [Streptococcus iniae]ASL35152.1 dephospho-CoA kinase [Streptococcus iniae]ATX40130.1 Dephospho-CoA kinase [Streptococcus iniae]
MSKVSEKRSRVIGLTGGIASGKSTVVTMLRQAGYKVIDADQVVHDLQKKGEKLYNALVAAFGEKILNEEAELDRPKLSEMIFSSPEKMELSSRIQNDIIQNRLRALKDQMASKETVFFMDIPLLIELGYQGWFDVIWLVYLDQQTQLDRLMARNHYSQEASEKRLASQMPLTEKKAYADIIIDNNGSLEALRKQVKEALKSLE